MIQWLRRCYRRIGIHTAPPGTLFFLVHSLLRRIVYWRIFGTASGNPYKRSLFGGIPYYDIARLRRTRPVGGLALVYFMGVGDYLMTTPLIRALHQVSSALAPTSINHPARRELPPSCRRQDTDRREGSGEDVELAVIGGNMLGTV